METTTETKFKTIVIENEDVFGVNIIDEPRDYSAESKLAGQQYHIGRYKGRGFTCTPEAYAAWKAGDMAKLTLTESEYERKTLDPVTNEETTSTTKSWTVDSFTTIDQLVGFLKKQVQVVELRANLEVIQKKALRSVELSDEKMKQLQDAI